MLLPAVAAGLAARGAPGVLHQRHGRRAGSRARSTPATTGGGAAQPAVPPGDDGQGAGLRLRHGRVQLAQDRSASCTRIVAFRVLARGQLPRAPHDPRLPSAPPARSCSDLFVQVVKLAREMGLVKLGTIAVDGTKIKANASRHKAMSYERMQQGRSRAQGADRRAAGARAAAPTRPRTNEPELDIPAEIARREARLAGHRRSARSGWSSASARPTSSAGAATTTSASRVTRTATPRAGATSASSACPRPRRRTTSPTPTAAS